MKRTRTKGKDEGLAVQAPAQEEEDEGCPTTATNTCWIPEVPPNPLSQYYATRNPQGAQPVLSVIVPLWFTPGTTSQALLLLHDFIILNNFILIFLKILSNI